MGLKYQGIWNRCDSGRARGHASEFRSLTRAALVRLVTRAAPRLRARFGNSASRNSLRLRGRAGAVDARNDEVVAAIAGRGARAADTGARKCLRGDADARVAEAGAALEAVLARSAA